MKLNNLKYMALLLVISTFMINIANAQFFKPIVAITGSVINESNKSFLSAKFSVFDITGKQVYSSRSNSAENGYYYIPSLTPGNTYTIKFDEPGYFKENFSIAIPATDKYIEISKDFLIKPLKLNQMLALPVNPFETNKPKLRYGASIVLEDIKNTLNSNPRVKFTIIVFPDSDNNKETNLKLTTERAEVLKDYFSTYGIDPSRIEIKGNELTDPKNPAPKEKKSKGKKYVGSIYLMVNKI